MFAQQHWKIGGKKPLKNIPVSKLFISNLHKKDREDCKRRAKRERIKGLKRKLSNTDGNMRDNMLHDMFCGDMQVLMLAMNRKIARKFGRSTEKCRKTETRMFRKKEENMAYKSVIRSYTKCCK